MLRRLRTAVEMDCDARVLRHGVGRRAYGTVLIEMAGRGPGLILGAPALAGSPSTLERRIRAMNARLPRFARLRAIALGVLALAALAGACESPLPTTAEIEKMDVAAAEARAGSLAMTLPGGNVRYIVDGKEVTREEAHALTSDRVVRIEMTRAAANESEVVRISTTPEAVADAQAEVRRAETRATGNGERVEVSVLAPTGERARVVPAGSFEGLVVIDGVVRDGSALRTISPEGIAQVEVIKGEAAVRQYDDPRAAYGVIRITTKAGAPANP
jgi:outer membrane receptor protein involved in Fe transport